MKKQILITSLFLLFCIDLKAQSKVYSGYYKASFENVWRGALLSLARYPLIKNSQDTGELRTQTSPEGEFYKPKYTDFNSKHLYSLNINVGKTNINGSTYTFVKIEKTINTKGDFFNSEKTLNSDGLEEQILLYRIGREVAVEKLIQRAFKN